MKPKTVLCFVFLTLATIYIYPMYRDSIHVAFYMDIDIWILLNSGFGFLCPNVVSKNLALLLCTTCFFYLCMIITTSRRHLYVIGLTIVILFFDAVVAYQIARIYYEYDIIIGVKPLELNFDLITAFYEMRFWISAIHLFLPSFLWVFLCVKLIQNVMTARIQF